MNLTIIVPTLGRPTLVRTLQSLADQPLDPTDVVMVVGQGSFIQQAAEAFGYQFIDCPPGGHGGTEERTVAIAQATSSHLAFIDDDDWWVPGARLMLQTAMEAQPEKPTLFRMRYRNGRVLWRVPVLQKGNVGTPMILIPNDPTKLGKWSTSGVNDYDFLASSAWGQKEIVWRTDVIAEIG